MLGRSFHLAAIGAIAVAASAAAPAAASSCCNCGTGCVAPAPVVVVEPVPVPVTPYYVVNYGPVYSGPGITTYPGYFESQQYNFEMSHRVYPYVSHDVYYPMYDGGPNFDPQRYRHHHGHKHSSKPAKYRTADSRVLEVGGGHRIIVYKDGSWRPYKGPLQPSEK